MTTTKSGPRVPGPALLVPRGAAILEGRLLPGDVDHFLAPLPSDSQLWPPSTTTRDTPHEESFRHRRIVSIEERLP